jgi:hypothetical protein
LDRPIPGAGRRNSGGGLRKRIGQNGSIKTIARNGGRKGQRKTRESKSDGSVKWKREKKRKVRTHPIASNFLFCPTPTPLAVCGEEYCDTFAAFYPEKRRKEKKDASATRP